LLPVCCPTPQPWPSNHNPNRSLASTQLQDRESRPPVVPLYRRWPPSGCGRSQYRAGWARLRTARAASAR